MTQREAPTGNAKGSLGRSLRKEAGTILRSRTVWMLAAFGLWGVLVAVNPFLPRWVGTATFFPMVGVLVWLGSFRSGAPGDDLRRRGYDDLRPGDAASILDFAERAATRHGAFRSGAAMIAKLPPRDELASTPLFVREHPAASVIEALRLLEELEADRAAVAKAGRKGGKKEELTTDEHG